MDLTGVQKGLKNLGGVILRKSPHILTGLGCAGVLTTAILTGKATIKAVYLVEEERGRRIDNCKQSAYGQDKTEEVSYISKSEAAKLTWKCYIPAGLMGVSSIACIIGANTINANRNAALAALYSLSETAFREYKEKVVEEIGRNKETKIRDSVTNDRITNNPVGDRTIIITGYGDTLCYDKLSDRYFKSSAEKIRQQVVELNYELMTAMWLDLNDLYDVLGLDPCKLGYQVGFDIDKGLIEILYSSHLTSEGHPCLAIDAVVYPNPRYI